jgi:endonuclease I
VNAGAGDYYKNINPSKSASTPLKTQLQNLIANHTVLSYDAVWDALGKVEQYLDTNCSKLTPYQIPDVYSAHCWIPSKPPTGQECGSYKKEGDCFNREHGWPKSWWGGFSAGHNAETDLHELWSSDGYVNGLRGNLPLGIVSTARYTSTSGAKIGQCAAPGYNSSGDICFEMGDEFKGDFARSYFYISTTYSGLFTCCNTPGTDGSNIKPWMEQLLRGWHAADPISPLELQRNDAIFAIQGNRLPFIDHPEWVSLIPDF